MATRASKRHKTTGKGDFYKVALPNHDEDFTDVHLLDTRLVRKSNTRVMSVPAEVIAVSRSEETWNSVKDWMPPDDDTFALDPDSAWYEEAVEGDIMENSRGDETEKVKKKKPKTKLSV